MVMEATSTLAVLMLTMNSGAAHDVSIGYPRFIPALPWAYYNARPAYVAYPVSFVPKLGTVPARATTEVPAVTIASNNDSSSSDLYGCNTDFGPWWTPDYCRQYLLHWSATSGDLPLTLSLLQSGRDINLQHNVERTALHIASHWGRASLVHLLLSKGADPTLTDMWGYTALELAEFKKCDDKEYYETWIRSCTQAENNYPKTLALLKAGCEMTGCYYPFNCENKRCIKDKEPHRSAWKPLVD